MKRNVKRDSQFMFSQLSLFSEATTTNCRDYVNAVSLIQIFLGLTLPNISKLECFVDVLINIDSKFREAIKNNGTLYVAKVKRKVQFKKKTGQYAIINFPMRKNHFQIQRVIRAYYEPSAPRLYRLL